FQNVLKRFEESTDLGDIVDDRFTVSDKIEYLLSSMQPGSSVQFSSLFVKATSKTEVIVTFLAVLELMKMNQFRIRQDTILGDIEVQRKDVT
ncbi:MAG: segregation/condensation protein A, partial [Verrucomicrobiae bacterium]|nr:segregation/condensation protein A [Verrucomicrobiae bacterium]NNJ87550.1 segregation/condensation protein A [Akkermansiaceae bacterium]